MTDYPRGTERRIESSTSPGLVRDAKILHYTVREAVRTSPNAFPQDGQGRRREGVGLLD